MKGEVPGLESLAVEGRRVLVRVDFNCPLADGRVQDDTRIRAALPTLSELLERGARPVLLTHLGRPKGAVVPELSTAVLAPVLSERLGAPVRHAPACRGEAAAQAIEATPAGGVTLLENVRFEPGETKGDPELARAMAALGEAFVNDAFGASHRAHASVAGIPAYLPSAAGRLLLAELAAFRRVLEDPARPLVAVLGGAKVSDKLPVIEHLLDRVQAVLVGGGMAYTFLAAQGLEIGNSLFEGDRLEDVRGALEKAKRLEVDLLLPDDHVIAQEVAAGAQTRVVDGAIPAGWIALDIGPRTRQVYAQRIALARTVVWNGPMGVFELEPFRAGTEAVGRAVAACPGYTVVGGGDSVAALALLGLTGQVDHVSTGGGASLELLEGRDLPGIGALRR